jgi:hypothetical protein
MPPVTAERQLVDVRDCRAVQSAIEMRKELPAARRLPAQSRAKAGGVDGEQNQATLTGAVSCRALPYLRSGRKMDEAVNGVLIGSVIAPNRQCGAPFVFATHMINQRRRHDGDANASLGAPTSLNATPARLAFFGVHAR